VVGTIIGGFIGVWLLGNYEQDRLVFLVFVFFYISFCMYMYRGSNFSYAFYLCAITLMSVCAYGIFDPLNAWHIGLGRVLEILTGVVSLIRTADQGSSQIMLDSQICRLRQMDDRPAHRRSHPMPSRFNGQNGFFTLSLCNHTLRDNCQGSPSAA